MKNNENLSLEEVLDFVGQHNFYNHNYICERPYSKNHSGSQLDCENTACVKGRQIVATLREVFAKAYKYDELCK